MQERPQLIKPILSHPAAQREWAAWALLAAIEQLFPEQIEELRDLETLAEMGSEEAGTEAFDEKLTGFVAQWAEKLHIDCYAVIDAAKELAQGATGPSPDTWGTLPVIEPIRARPTAETRDEFLQRAREHYDEVVKFYLRDYDDAEIGLYESLFGRHPEPSEFKKGPVKRGAEPLHFLFLAAHLIGGYSFAQLASGETRFNLPVKEASAIAEAVRGVARLLDLPLPNKPGPRKGSRSRRAAHRASR